MVNELVREYNDLAMFTKEYQEHGGAKDANTPYVDYNYDESATGGEFTKGLRLTSLRYPDGRLVHHTYGTSGSDADNLNRLDAIKDDSSGSPGATLAQYTYLGLDQVVVLDLPEPDIKLDLFGGTSGSYAGLDRFDRVVDQRWYDYGASEDRDRFKYGYDRASNRTWKENTVSKSLSTPVYLDEFYTYDGLHRLKTFDRGELNATKTGITGTPAREEDWTLDPLGNWSGYWQKTSGTTDLDQERTVNPVNEITDITETTGTSWITPSYDRNGNMVLVPRPDDLANGYTCTYDGWNRLVKVEAGISTVAAYAYDSLHRRIKKTTDSTVRHFHYSAQWQVLEERLDTSTDPDRQFIWGPLYIDHLILRDRDTSGDGTLDERLCGMQDANFNVTGTMDSNGAVQERYAYSGYGVSVILTSSFTDCASSEYDWESRFGGYRWDHECGCYQARNRVLHSAVGPWLQRDEIRASWSGNLYEYAKSRPIDLVDPVGRQAAVLRDSGNQAGRFAAPAQEGIDEVRFDPPARTQHRCDLLGGKPNPNVVVTDILTQEDTFQYTLSYRETCYVTEPVPSCLPILPGEKPDPRSGVRKCTVTTVYRLPRSTRLDKRCLQVPDGKYYWHFVRISHPHGEIRMVSRTKKCGICQQMPPEVPV